MAGSMNRSRILLTALGAASIAATAIPMLPAWLNHSAQRAPLSAEAVPDRHAVVVDLQDNASAADIQDLDTRYGLDLQPNSVEAADDKVMRATVSGDNEDQLVAELRKDARVEAAEPEMLYGLPEQEMAVADAAPVAPAPGQRGGFVPNDPRYNEQWNLKMVGAEAAWERTRGKGIVVAVIDTGVAATDSPRGKQARDFGQTHFARGYDFVHKDDDAFDDNGHGTHVAGTIAESTNNKEGVAGLAFEATIMPLKVLTGEGWGTAADIADAIRFAADKGADVINMSLGSSQPSAVIHNAVKYAAKKHVVIVCAAGNGFGPPVGYPAAFPECIAVSSVGPTKELAFYSSYGKEVALAAPGGDMTKGPQDGILQNTIYPEEQGGRGDDYYPFQGTSMAAPHVAAAAALVMAQGVKDPARVRDLLTRSAMAKGPKDKYGAGILSVSKATAMASEQRREFSLKYLLFAALAGLLLLALRRTPFALRLALTAALGAGLFGPDRIADLAGANSAWNLIAFSALIPFLLTWELEKGVGSKIVAALAAGIGLCLAWNGLTSTLPFTVSEFGQRALPWTIANAGAALLIAAYAWRRGRA